VPADLRLFQAMNLNCDEKSLTGEAEPVGKSTEDKVKVPGFDILATSEEAIDLTWPMPPQLSPKVADAES
jgi:Na+-exporting ATPase